MIRNWLLLRGLARESRHWDAFPAALTEVEPGCHVMTLDLPGAGREFATQAPLTISGVVDLVRAQWEERRGARQEEGKWGVLAVSLGGMVAMDWAARFPADFGGVVLVNSSVGAICPPWWRLRPSILPEFLGAVCAADPVAREVAVLRMTSNRMNGVEDLARKWAAFRADAPVSRLTLLRQLAAAARFRSPASLIPPVLVLSSDADRLVDPRCSERIATHFGAQWRRHPHGGHDLTLDDPAWVATEVGAWARSLNS